jgi:hypothetical protein
MAESPVVPRGSIRTPPTCCGTWMKSASGRRERERPEYSDGGWSAPLVTAESDALRRAIAGESFRESMNHSSALHFAVANYFPAGQEITPSPPPLPSPKLGGG